MDIQNTEFKPRGIQKSTRKKSKIRGYEAVDFSTSKAISSLQRTNCHERKQPVTAAPRALPRKRSNRDTLKTRKDTCCGMVRWSRGRERGQGNGELTPSPNFCVHIVVRKKGGKFEPDSIYSIRGNLYRGTVLPFGGWPRFAVSSENLERTVK